MKKDICGIYGITNKLNNKIYIGKSIHIFRRWAEHKQSIKYGKPSSYLKRAFIKYGIENFEITILKECNEPELKDLECFFIRVYCSWKQEFGYNETFGGEGGGFQTEALRKRKSESLKKTFALETPEHRKERYEKASKSKTGLHYNIGHEVTDSTKNKIKDTKIKNGTWGLKQSEESRLKIRKYLQERSEEDIQQWKKVISNSRKGKCMGGDNPFAKKVICIQTGVIFNSIIEAKKWANIKSNTSIRYSCIGKYKYGGKHPETGEKLSWKYYDKD
jgi:group I intron endonuclease